jgi:tetratricopeptide (TPR) repeat protein
VLARLPTPGARTAAIEQCERLLEIAPDYADLRLNLGGLLLAENRSAEAIPHLRRALEMNPANESARRLLTVAEQTFDTEPENR